MIKCLACMLALLAGLLSRATEAEETLKIGSILILSGEGASWGNAARNGIELAIERINSQGGVMGKKLEVVYQDDQADPKRSIAAFHQLIDVEKVRFIIGPSWSRLGLPLVDIANRKKIVMISPTIGMAKFTQSGEFLFSTYPLDRNSAKKLAEYVFNRGKRRIALVSAQDPWVIEQRTAFQERFEELGGTIAFFMEPNTDARDFRTEALKITKTPDVDAIVSTTDGILVGSLLAKALKSLNTKIPIYSVTVDQKTIDAAEGGFEGMEFATFFTPDKEFKAEYEKRFGAVDVGSDSAYDATMILAEAIRKSGTTDTETIAREIGKITKYEGASGKLLSDGSRGFTKNFLMKKVVNGTPIDFQSTESSGFEEWHNK